MGPSTKVAEVAEVQKLQKDVNEIKAMLKAILRNMNVAYDEEATGCNEESMHCSKELPDELSLDTKITIILKEIGIPAHLSGYDYVRTAIKMCMEDPSLMRQVTKALYPDIAKQYHTKSSRVERAIRHAIEVGCNRGNIDLIYEIFSYTISSEKSKPTNSEFIATIVDYLKMN